MLRIEGAENIVAALDSVRLETVRLNRKGPDGPEYYAEITKSGLAIVPFAGGRIEIYDKTEWRKD